MTVHPTSTPDALSQHLSANSGEDLPSITAYLEKGAALVTPQAIDSLRKLRLPLQQKIAALGDSSHLRQRTELLATYFDENLNTPSANAEVFREVTFALLYFLKGFDRIPDTVPEIGLLDDALIVQTVLQRHSTALRAHWLRQGRTWPAED
jgi:uncharacterized membrane protein YkvA (DUF1232 family)